jgi:hypothetical protein
MSVSFYSSGQSQLYSLMLNNTTNNKLFVTGTWYYKDSTKTNTNEFIMSKSKFSSSSEIYKQYIRVDIFAFYSSTNDTVFSTTINLFNFDSTKLSIDIIADKKTHLPTMHPVDRLKIKTNNRDLVFKEGDKLEVKTNDSTIVKGLVLSYNNSSLTICNGKKISKITLDNINAIKLCQPIIDISASFSLFKTCTFHRIDPSSTKLVKQEQVMYPNNYIDWDWR